MVFKCKMCGGDIEAINGTNTGKCLYCKSVMTLPNIDDEKILNLYNRANDLRLANQFDDAKEIYEKILIIDNSQVEAHWGLLLCKYGVEYVDDPKTKKKIPTCHRTIDSSILVDTNFKFIKKEAFGDALNLYECEAKQIADIQKGILAISKNEDPYDIFICYKETDDKGERTKDSVIAQDIYDKLVDNNYKVFFARITLEDKLGVEYEPYIYSALKSSKVMLVVGTQEEYFNAVWVKNEWSRFLEMMESDKSKYLIPVYSKIDAYKLPEEFAMLQAQSMDKIGAMQDLIRGIKKITDNSNKNQNIDEFTYEMYAKFKKIEEDREKELLESTAPNKKVSKVYEVSQRNYKIVTFILSFLQAVVVLYLLGSQIIFAHGLRGFSLNKLLDIFPSLGGVLFLSCFLTFIAYFIGIFSRKSNKLSKYLYLANIGISALLCLVLNLKNYKVTFVYYLFVGLNLILFLYKPKWALKENIIFVTTEEKEQILEDNDNLKKNFVEKDKFILKKLFYILAIFIMGASLAFNFMTTPMMQSNGRNRSVEQLKVKSTSINIRKNTNINSKQLGQVYAGEIYTILDFIDGGKNGWDWYKIRTETGIEGYITSGNNGSYIELLK